MSNDAWFCSKVPFKGSEALPVNLFYRLNINTREFSVKVPANGMQNQSLRIVNLFKVNITYSCKIFFEDGKIENIWNSNSFNNTFKIEVKREKPIKEIIYAFHLAAPCELPFQTMLNARSY